MHNEFYDKYEIIKELSCSTHSKVYLVRHRILDVYRVAKIFSGNQQDARRLMKEAHLIKNLKHPHIPVIYDIEQNIGEDNDSICKNEKIISMQIADIRLFEQRQSVFDVDHPGTECGNHRKVIYN